MKPSILIIGTMILALNVGCNPKFDFENTDSAYVQKRNLIANNDYPTEKDILENDISDVEDTINTFEKAPPPPVVEIQPVEKIETQTEELNREIASFENVEPLAVAEPSVDETPKAKIEEPKIKVLPLKPPESEVTTPKEKVLKNEMGAFTSPNSQTELFEETQSKVDILFVVDNSSSMAKEQKKLGERLESFLNGIKDTDWQIAFTTSDVSNGKYGIKGSLLELANHPGQKVLTSQFGDAREVFFNTVQRSEGKNCIFHCPSSNEQPLKASMLAIEKSKSENAEFFRKDADLAIVILTDEDEMSIGSKKATRPQDVVNTFRSTFGESKKLSVYGIIIQPNDLNCFANQKTEGFSDAYPGKSVLELAKITDGYTGSICEKDYSIALNKIGEQTRYIADSFQLKKIPITSSVRVKLTPEQDIEWKVEKNHLHFVTPPKEGTLVQVSYNYM